jgi:RNA polymerase-binding transcription factor DksA
MPTLNDGGCFHRLCQRREQLLTTLRHLDGAQRAVDENTHWLDQAAYENRRNLLDRLNDWNIEELAEVENALERLRHRTYGKCAACHAVIDAARLEAAPEAAYCGACQESLEAL